MSRLAIMALVVALAGCAPAGAAEAPVSLPAHMLGIAAGTTAGSGTAR